MTWMNYMEPSYDQHEIDAVSDYMNSGAWLTEFKKTREFEKVICDYTGSPHCSVMSNGTVTLLAALMACGITAGDEVVVPDFTMAATAHAVAMLGATAVFADVEEETLCIDYESMVRAITPKTKAVIIVDLNGRCALRFDEIIHYCKNNGLWLIEDAAQALGSTHRGESLGTFGDIGSYSFSMPKIITTGQGGAVVTATNELMNRMLKIRDFGRAETGSDHYVMVGGNFKFTDLQAVIGIEQMKKLSARVARKKAMGQLYDSLLADIPQIGLFKNNYAETAPCFIEILCEERRDLLAMYLKDKNIGTRPFYPPLHSEPAYGYTQMSFPKAEKMASKGLWLPSSMNITDEQIVYICQQIRNYYS